MTLDAERPDAQSRHVHWAALVRRGTTAAARERAAEARDVAAAARDQALLAGVGAADLAEHVRLAAEDRRLAAQDRLDAARERRETLDAFEAIAADLTDSQTDPLTGVRVRTAGLADLDHEIGRCRRTNAPLTVAYIDVIGLKAVNDTLGHTAGDNLLIEVVGNLRAHLRPYDLITRLGGDEFLCAMPGFTLHDARTRFAAITSDTVPAPDARRVRAGFAALRSGDTVPSLIARADAELTDGRRAAARERPSALDARSVPVSQRVDLEALLDAVHEFGAASLELLAWEFSVPEGALRAHWELSINEKLLTAEGVDAKVGEPMYKLSELGQRRLGELRASGEAGRREDVG